jgi:7-carboxy-7-deazaguanine synthase
MTDKKTEDASPSPTSASGPAAAPSVLQAMSEQSNDPLHARLKIHEIFHSLQGEADAIGWPTAFVRLTGCPLRCVYCDTEYAFTGGHWHSTGEILDIIKPYQVGHVCVTGGEPLAQRRCHDLLKVLCDAGYQVSIETSGAISIAEVDQRVSIVMDLKTPDSQESHRNLWSNLEHLKPGDQIKFVICSESDFRWAAEQVREHDLPARCQVLFSPSYEQIKPRELAQWIIDEKLPVRFQMQLHKQLWGEEPGR